MPIIRSLKDVKDNTETLLDINLNLFNRKRDKGFEIAIKSVDELVGGIRPSTLTIFGAFTGMGKTLFSLNIVNDMLNQKVKTMYVDLENGPDEILERLIRIKYKLNKTYFDNKDNSGKTMTYIHEIEKYFDYLSYEALEEVGFDKKGLPYLIQILEKKASQGVKLFVIDPLQALQRENQKDRSLNEQGEIVKKLKEFAQKNEVAVIINHHIRKSVGNAGKFVKNLDEVNEQTYRLPNLDDFKGSSQITDYATDVWAMVRTIGATDKTEKGHTLFRVLKSRRRFLGDAKLFFDVDTLNFYEETKAYDDPAYIRGDKQ